MPSKNESKKVKRKKLDPKIVTPKDEPDQAQEDSKTSFDFGGLPTRDFKKNLGCG